MGMKEVLMHFGIPEGEAEKLVAENISQYRANVAYSESIRDLSQMTGPEDFQ